MKVRIPVVVMTCQMILLCSLFASSCSSAGNGQITDEAVENVVKEKKVEKQRRYLIETQNGIALVQLYADGFEELSLQEKLLAYYLYKAAVAGRDITYDQNHRHALTIRNMLDQVLSHPLGLDPEVEQKIQQYARLFWLNNGPYYERNKTKFTAEFTLGEWVEALGVARANGADFSFAKPSLEQVVADVEDTMFNPLVEPKVTNKNPGPDGDILSDSANNYYHGVTMKDLEGFTEANPLNSRLTKECDRRNRCKLVEEVYKAGKKGEGDKWEVEPGRYAAQLREMVTHMEKAAWFGSEGQKKAFTALANYFSTGDPKQFDEASIAWLKEDPTVDAIIGFIETYKDSRSQKGEYEGLVYYTDKELTSMMKAIAANAGHFEENSPWADEYKKKDIQVPVASAINVLVGVGGAGPNIPAGINLPNAQWIREKHGSRSVMLSNVMAAARAAVSDAALSEFALPSEMGPAKTHLEAVHRVRVALHEIVGHGSGKASAKLTSDPSSYLKETYAALEEARAELVALHHMFDPRLVEIGAISGPEAAVVAYQDYLRAGLLQLRRVKTGGRFEDDHMRATHLIVQYLLKNPEAAEIQTVQGKTYYVLKDVEAARKTVAELLTEVMRIKAEGDLEAAREMVNTYAVDFDPGIRDEVVQRAQKSGVPDFVAFHVPGVRLVLDENGEPSDVVLDYTKDFVTTMLEWDLVGAN
jgi:dipeptidyl-peptidase III